MVTITYFLLISIISASGVFLGVLMGILIAALCHAAKKGDGDE